MKTHTDKTKKLLIVDDHNEFRRTVRSYIAKQFPEIELFEADSEDQALETARRERPGIILLELQLPQMNGIKTAKLLKKLNASSKIIIMSGYSADNINNKSIDHIIGKNEIDNDLVKILKKYIKKNTA